MSRDVVLDIIFTKMIGREYLAGVDCEWAALEEDVKVARGLVTKGLVREYAGALQRQDTERMTQVSKALDEVPVMKATELWNMLTGQVQRDVRRDERGRFARNISAESSPALPAPGQRGGRQKGTATATDELRSTIEARMKGGAAAGDPDPKDPAQQGEYRKRGMRQAGQVRAIQRLQDELLDLFGDDAGDDVVVIVETVPEPGQEAQQVGTVGLKDPVSQQTVSNPDGALPAADDVPLQITYGLKGTAKPDTREKFNTLGGLVDIGMRPESALAYASGKDGAAKTPGQQLASAGLAYGGRKKDTNKDKAARHFNTADKLGTYFADTNVPQLQSAGRALKATAAVGRAVPDDAYAMAERANYRYRGMKDNLPKAMTQAMKSGEHKLLVSAFDDPELTPEKWAANLKRVGDHLQEMEVRNKDAFNADPFRPVLAAAIAATPAGVSPRDFLDRYNRDLAIMSLIPELPADSRAVKLGEMAGFGVPSSGVVIRPDGAFKEMYRGVGPDHYLPFSGKALPELRDGQYVRTRYRGGLTNEDITVLVASGARKATVVSSSGMFTIELKPDTSVEGRMKSPEVAAMGERYERILDQITNAEDPLYMKDLEPQVKERLHNQATKFTGQGPGGELHRNRFKTLVEKERAAQSQLTEEEITKITEDVVAQAKAGTLSDEDAGRTTEMLIKEALSDARKEKVRAISLNAEGYGMALETLRLQYPSIIRRVSYEPLKDFVSDRGLKGAIDPATLALRNRPGGGDSGYTRPGTTSPHTKGWTRNEDGSPIQAKRGEVAGITGAGGAGGTEPKKGEPKKVGTANEVFGNLFAARSDAIKAVRDQAKKDYPSLPQDKADQMLDEWTAAHAAPEKFAAMALADVSQKGPDADLETTGHPGWLAFMGASGVTKAVKDDNGVTLAMALAYNPEVLDNAALWEGGDAQGEEARLALDNVASVALLDAPIKDTPMTSGDKYGFYLAPEVRAVIPEGDDINVAETLAAVEQVAYDAGSDEGKARITAKSFLDKAVAEGDKSLSHGRDVSGIQDLSVLGLLALQTRTMKQLDEAKWSQTNIQDSTRTLIEGLNGGDESAFYDQAGFDTAKKNLATAVQGAIGAEFIRRLLGGGDAGPKGQSRVAKSDRPLLALWEDHLRDRAVAKSSSPHPAPRPRPRLQSSPTSLRRSLAG